MAEQILNIYWEVLNELDKFKPQLEEAFYKRSEGNSKIIHDKFDDLINDFGIILAIDVENGSKWINNQNHTVEMKYDLTALTFQEFIEIFSDWLYFESGHKGNKPGKGIIKKVMKEPIKNPNESIGSPIKKVIPEQNLGFYQSNEPKKIDLVDKLTDYRQNKRKLDEFLTINIQEIKDNFDVRAIKTEDNQQKMNVNDLYPFLQETFDICGLELVENPYDEQDFFQRSNSLIDFFKKVKAYLIEVQRMPQEILKNFQECRLSFTEAFGVIDYWLQTDEHVMIYTKMDRKAQGEENTIQYTLRKTIKNYEKLLDECSTPLERIILTNTIETLKKQLEALNKITDSVDLSIIRKENPGISKKEDKKKKALKRIYNFYCKMQANIGKSTTFSKIESETTLLNLGKMSMICKDFLLFKKKFNNHKMIELFKKISSNTKDLTLDEFERIIEKISLEVYKDDANMANDLDKIDSLYEHMGVYSGEYKTKLNNRVLPFHSYDKESFRLPLKSLEYKFKYKAHSGKLPEEIGEEIKRRQEQRELAKKQKNEKPNDVSHRSDIYHDLKKLESKGGSYVEVNNIKNKIAFNPEKNKFTLEKLENMQYIDFKGYNDKFDPSDLIDDGDEEDKLYLAEYNINTDPISRKKYDQDRKKKSEEYSYSARYSNIHENKKGKLGDIIIKKNDYSKEHLNTGGDNDNNDNIRGSANLVKKYLFSDNSNNENIHRLNQKNVDRSQSEIRSPDNPTIIGGKMYGKNGAHRGYISSNILDRAHEINQKNKLKEHQYMENAMLIQDNQIKKGIIVLKRIK